LTFKGEVVEKSNIDKTSANVYLDQSVVDAYTSVKSSSIITSASERISKTLSTGFIRPSLDTFHSTSITGTSAVIFSEASLKAIEYSGLPSKFIFCIDW
jgi:hypothetical protein